MRKRIISLVLTVVMLLSMLPVLSVPADANSTVKAKLDTFMNSYPSGGRWTGTFDGGSQCYGFAKMVLYNLFDQYHGWYYNGTPTKGLNVIGSTTDYSYSSVQSLLSNAKCGDLLQFDQTKQHSMIVYAVESDGVWIYDCNWDWNCGISLRKCSFGTWSGRNSNKLTLLRSTNYPEDNPPPKPTVYMNGTTSHLDIASGNSINFTFYAPEAETVHLFIYKWSDLIYDEYFSPSGSYTMKFDDVGKYSCVIIAHNSGGYTYSEWTDWTVRHTVIQRFISPYGKSYDCNTAYNNAVKSGYAQNKVYFWYRIYDTSTGDLYNSYTSKTYNVHMSIKDPDGNEISSCDYSNSDNNWLGFVPQKSGTYTCTTTVTGDINVTGSSTYSVSYNASLSASQNTVSLNLNGTNTASVNFTPSGSLPGKRAYSWSGENGVVSVSGGGWSSDGTYFTLNFKGLKYGSNDITVKLHEKYTESASVVATVLIHVNVDANKYTVSYNANGGTGAPSSQTKYYGTDLTLSSSRPSKSYTVTFNANGGTSSVTTKTANCMFNNWNTKSDGTGTTYSPGAAYTANAALALYAIWSNPTVGTLPTPTRSGYTFDGWYTTSNGGNKIYTSTTVSSNITYYAHWTPSDTTLPSGSISSTNNAASSQTVTLTMSDDVALAGYYWGTSSSTSPSFTSISGISKTVTVTVSSSGTYYLTVKDTGGNIFQTSKTFYKTTLDANGGSVSPTSIITASGNSFTFPTPTKDGYTYNGWSTSSTATSGITSLTPTGNTTYYAVWKIFVYINYTVTYDANGGTGAPPAQTAITGNSLILSSTIPTKEYTVTFDPNGGSVSETKRIVSSTFLSWNTESDGTGFVYRPGGTYSFNSSVTLYALWDVNSVGTLPTPTRNGYVFDGWYTASSGGNIRSASSIVASNTTYYAHWTAKDTTKPFVSVKITNNLSNYQTFTYTLSDNVGLAGYYFGADSSTSPNYKSISGTSYTGEIEIYTSGTYYLTVKDTGGNIYQTSYTFYKTTLNANGGSVSPAAILTVRGCSFDFPTPTKDGYTYNGWSTSSSATSGITSLTPTGDTTYYAVWKKNVNLSSISVKTMPTKTTYNIGDPLDTTGLSLSLNYDDGSVKTITSGYTVSGFDTSTAGSKYVKVNYGGFSTGFQIMVIDSTTIGIKIEKLTGYDVKLTGLDPALSYVIRYATGEYASANAVKKGLNAGFIQVSGVTEAVITLPTDGVHTVCATVGSEQKFIGTVTIEQTDIEAQFRASSNDLSVKVENLYGANRVNLIKNGNIVMKINASSFTSDGLKTWAEFNAPGAGDYTVRIYYADGTVVDGDITITVPEAAVYTNGRIFTLADYGANNVSYIRFAKGAISTTNEMKTAPDLRTFGRKYFTGETAAFAALDAVNGTSTAYTVQIVYASGYYEFITFDITPTVPGITTTSDSIILTNVESSDYYIDWVRCAPGELTTLSQVRHTKGSQVKKTEHIVNDTITFTGLFAGKYTLYYLYDGWNLSEGIVTVTVG